MGKVVMPKNSAVEEEIKAALKIYYEENDWLKNDVFTQRLKEIIGGDQYHSSYTKKVQMTSYYGFTIWENFSNPQSRRKITSSGRRFYEAWISNNKDKMLDEVMYSLETTVFGRNNCGCSDSDSDVEIPSVFIRTVLEMGYLVYNEFAYLLWQMEDCGVNYTDAVKALREVRDAGNLVLTDEAKRYTDAKPIMMLIRWGFLAEDGKIGASTKIVIAENVLKRYGDRLKQLKIYNVDKFTITEDVADEYKRAADIVSAHISESGLTFEENVDEIQQVYDEFRSRYAPEVLEALSDSELLRSMFYTTESTNDSLCYFLEFEARSRKFCGSIAGGSSYKFGLFQKKDDGIWITGSPSRPEELTDEQALSVGKEIRDALIRGSKIIETASLENLEDYEKLDNDLNAALGKYASWGWVHKYFHMLFPDKLSAFHSTDWQKHILYALLIKPSERYFARSGQIAMVSRYANLIYRHMFEACYDKFGGVKKFCRLGTNDREVTYTDEWKKQNIVGIGWNNIGNLEDFVSGNEINRKAVCEKIQEEYYSDNPTLASRKAGEIATFYRSNTDTIFVTMDGHKLLALVDNVGKYYYDADGGMAHKKAGIWHCCFGADESLPNKAAGHMTSCYELTDEENLMYLYEKYYYDLNEEEEEEVVSQMVEYIEPVYNTDLETEFECNRIVFGAPGTGKSYKLKDDSGKLLDEADGTLERVTFHPDYSYAQFVGTYKPVTDANGDIRYAFVPGPFMRVYVDAIKSGRTEVKPHLLLIEEINRAKVAAVFGDVFQLLDRDDDGVSEYEIQTSEDIRKYLASELGGTPDNWKKIKLPNNMFIWATMNSADQGVFPMDTAFKRRWSFEYLGINQNEEKITGKIVLGGDEEPVVWNKLRKAINDKLAKDYKVNEDKLMGPFFLSKKVIKTDEAGMIADTKKFIDTFKSKVIMYLYEDAAKQHKHKLFSGCDSSKYSSVCDAFEEIGMGIFGEDFKANYYDQQEG